MPAPSVTEATAPLRLLLIDGAAALGPALAAPLAAEVDPTPVVIELTTGRLALDLLRSSGFDVIAADLDALADLGDKAEERIARLTRAASGALILTLAHEPSISFALAAMRAGAHDCVARSIEPEALVGRMGELARRHGKARAFGKGGAAPAASDVPAPSIPVMRDLVLPMWRQEQKIIETAIQSFAGNIALAAAALELSPSTIYRKRQAWAELDNRRLELASVSAR